MKPLLVIVTGVPAAGKTTLGRRLAPELSLVRLCKDEIREAIGAWLPPKTHAESKPLGGAAYAVCVRLAEESLASGVGVLIEAAFSRGAAEPMLAPLVARSRAVQIHLHSSLELSNRRFRERYARGERHPAHMDEAAVAHDGLLWELGWERWAKPLQLDVPTLSIDTNEGFVTELDEILAFIRQAWTAGQR